MKFLFCITVLAVAVLLAGLFGARTVMADCTQEVVVNGCNDGCSEDDAIVQLAMADATATFAAISVISSEECKDPSYVAFNAINIQTEVDKDASNVLNGALTNATIDGQPVPGGMKVFKAEFGDTAADDIIISSDLTQLAYPAVFVDQISCEALRSSEVSIKAGRDSTMLRAATPEATSDLSVDLFTTDHTVGDPSTVLIDVTNKGASDTLYRIHLTLDPATVEVIDPGDFTESGTTATGRALWTYTTLSHDALQPGATVEFTFLVTPLVVGEHEINVYTAPIDTFDVDICGNTAVGSLVAVPPAPQVDVTATATTEGNNAADVTCEVQTNVPVTELNLAMSVNCVSPAGAPFVIDPGPLSLVPEPDTLLFDATATSVNVQGTYLSSGEEPMQASINQPLEIIFTNNVDPLTECSLQCTATADGGTSVMGGKVFFCCAN